MSAYRTPWRRPAPRPGLTGRQRPATLTPAELLDLRRVGKRDAVLNLIACVKAPIVPAASLERAV